MLSRRAGLSAIAGLSCLINCLTWQLSWSVFADPVSPVFDDPSITCTVVYCVCRSHTSCWSGWSAESVSGSHHRRPRSTGPRRCTRSSRRRPRHRQKVSMQGSSRRCRSVTYFCGNDIHSFHGRDWWCNGSRSTEMVAGLFLVLRATEWRPSAADWGIGMSVMLCRGSNCSL